MLCNPLVILTHICLSEHAAALARRLPQERSCWVSLKSPRPPHAVLPGLLPLPWGQTRQSGRSGLATGAAAVCARLCPADRAPRAPGLPGTGSRLQPLPGQTGRAATSSPARGPASDARRICCGSAAGNTGHGFRRSLSSSRKRGSSLRHADATRASPASGAGAGSLRLLPVSWLAP